MKYLIIGLMLLISPHALSEEKDLFYIDKQRAIEIAKTAVIKKYGKKSIKNNKGVVVQHVFPTKTLQIEHLQVQFIKQSSTEQLKNGFEKVHNKILTVQITRKGKVLGVKDGMSYTTKSKRAK